MLYKQFIIITILTCSYTISTPQIYTLAQSIGIWTDTITSSNITNTNPSTHGICGFSFRQMIYTKKVFCPCKLSSNKFQTFSFCDQESTYKSNAIKITYCSFTDPTQKINKTIQTGNTQSGRWREVMCPPNLFVHKVAVRINGTDASIQLGLNGIQSACSSIDLNTTQVVQDNYTYALTPLTNNSNKTFATGVSVKYEKSGKLTGLKIYFQTITSPTPPTPTPVVIPEISNIDIAWWGNITYLSNLTSVLIETIVVQNTDSTSARTELLKFTLNYTITEKWTNNQSLLNSTMGSNVKIFPPSLPNTNSNDSSYYSKFVQGADFGRQITITYVPDKTIPKSLYSCQQLTFKSYIDIQMGTASYTATITYVNPITKAFMSTQIVNGTWQGTMHSPIRSPLKLNSTVPGCQ